MLERILVPLDASDVAEQVLPYASLLAKKSEGAVTLFAAVSDTTMLPIVDEYTPIFAQYAEDFAALDKERRDDAARYLKKKAQELAEQGIAVDTEVGTGTPGDSILAAALTNRATLIAMATHGRVGPERWFLGSVAESVVHKATVPVLLIRPGDDGKSAIAAINRIVLPLDGSELSEVAIPHAIALAKAFAAPITVVRTLDLSQFNVGMADPYDLNGLSATLVESLETEGRSQLAIKARAIREEGIAVDERFVVGSPASEITETAEKVAGSLVVMGTHGRSGLGRTILGSVAARVIRSSVAPVIVIRPQ